jgi:hypothetical protein
MTRRGILSKKALNKLVSSSLASLLGEVISNISFTASKHIQVERMTGETIEPDCTTESLIFKGVHLETRYIYLVDYLVVRGCLVNQSE